MAAARRQVPGEYAAVYEGYAAVLSNLPAAIDPDTRRVYDFRIRGYLAWLATAGLDWERPLVDPHDRDFATRDYQAYLKAVRKLRPPRWLDAAKACCSERPGWPAGGPSATWQVA